MALPARALGRGMHRLILVIALMLALFALLTAALASARPLRVDAREPSAERNLWGFYRPEPGMGAIFRWSGPQARILLHGAPSVATQLTLRMSGERLVAQGTPQVSLSGGTTRLAAFDVVPGWRIYHVLLPPGAAATLTGVAQRIDLSSATSLPGSSHTARDYRPLGLPLDWLRIAPLKRDLADALARSLLLCWAIGLAAASAAWIARLARPQATRLPTFLSVATIAILGGGLVGWAWRDSYSLAWALPPTPWALGLLSLLLGVAVLKPWDFSSSAPSPLAPLPPGERGDSAAGRLRLPLSRAGRGGWGVRAEQRWISYVKGIRALPIPSGPIAVTGLGVLAVAQGALNSQVSVGPAIILALVGLLLLLVSPSGLGAGLGVAAADSDRRQASILLGLIVILAFGLRLSQITSLPLGLWRDEARHGLAALRINSDPLYRPVYIDEGRVNMPALTIYFFAMAIKVLGVHLWTMRLITALAGVLTLLPLYALATRLSGRRAIGLLATLLLAVSSWHISISRFSFPTVFDPLFSLTGWWLLDVCLGPHGPRRPVVRIGLGLLSGICFGLAMQTYHTGRVVPLIGAWLALLIMFQAPQAWRGWLAGTVAIVIGLVICTAPLAVYALSQPAAFNNRVSDVLLVSPNALRGTAPLTAIDETVRRHLLMFNVQGDLPGRHHAPGRPMLDYVTGLLFLVGITALLRRLSDWRSLFLLGALATSLLPSALAVDAPHAMRSFGAVPLACLIAALGAAELVRMLSSVASKIRPLRLGGPIILALAIVLNVWIYFVIMPFDPEVFLAFYPVQSQMGVYVRDTAQAGGRIYVPRDVTDNDSFAFLSADLPVETFDSATPSVVPQPGDRFLISGYFIDQELADLAPFLGPNPRPLAAGPAFPDGRGPTFLVYEVP